MYWLILSFVFIFLSAASHPILNMLTIYYIQTNRQIWALTLFSIVTLPKTIVPHMNALFSWGTYVLCGIFVINFMIEQHRWFVTSEL